MEKKTYETPEMEVVELEDDVILTSGDGCVDLYSAPNGTNYTMDDCGGK